VLPLMRPAIAALSVLIFTFIWNDFFWATVLTQGRCAAGHRRAVLAERSVDRAVAPGLRRASTLSPPLPPVLMFFLMQRHFIAWPDARRNKGRSTTDWRAAKITSPTLLLSWSEQGLNGLSQAFHRHLRAIQTPVNARREREPRPVHYNCWEAVYFRHELDELKSIASLAGNWALSASSSMTAGSAAATTTLRVWATGRSTEQVPRRALSR
jgi:hypothetical protein